MTVHEYYAPATYVPALSEIRRVQAVSVFTVCEGSVASCISLEGKPEAHCRVRWVNFVA